MRIKSIKARNTEPVKLFEIDNLSDIVVIAGPNGIGKTRLINSLLTYFQNYSDNNVKFIIEATSQEEKKSWGKKQVDTSIPSDVQLLRNTLQKNQSRRNFNSNILNYESNRSIQNIKPLAFEWDIKDPWEEAVSWNIAFDGLSNRFQDTLHAIFKKIQSQKTSIANRAITLKNDGHKSMNLEFSDPLEPFKKAFYQLLGPKKLEKADVRNNTLIYSDAGKEYNINSLSSGEREVLNITFDFILRKPSHCIVFFDEPELHLHPELSSKLINTLKSVGINNQFIFCSHSPDIISSSLDDSVIFLTPDKGDGSNQALLLKSNDSSTEALHRLGQSIGVVSLGKKIVLIEGNNASLDKQTYGHILKNRFSDLVLLPSGGKGNLQSFETIIDGILNKSIWGVEFYMLADRDAKPVGDDSPALLGKVQGRFRSLSKYHLENYFLDQFILASIFSEMEPEGSWLRDPEKINAELKKMAKSQISYTASLVATKRIRDAIGNVNIMIKGCHGIDKEGLMKKLEEKRKKEELRINEIINNGLICSTVEEVYSSIESSLSNGDDLWKNEIPGRQIFRMFCNKASIQEGRLKSLYIKKADQIANNPFQEIIDIFSSYSDVKVNNV